MLKKTKNVKFIRHFPCLVISCFLVFFIFLTDSVNVKAEGNPLHTYTLPYVVDDYLDNQTLFPDDFYLTVLSDYLASQPQSWGGNLGSDYAIFTGTRDGSKIYVYVFSDFSIVPDTSNWGSVYSNPIQIKTNSDRTNIRMSYSVGSDGSLTFSSVNNAYYADTTLNIFGSYQSTEFLSTGLTYQQYYPLYIPADVYDQYNNLVMQYTPGTWVEQEAFEDFQDALDITSTLSNGINNTLTDLQNQKSFFDNLVANLKNFFNALNGWINNGFTFLAKNIKNFFGPLLRNIQNYISEFFGSFEDFKDKWDHFFEIINSIYNMSLENGEFSLAKLISVLLVPDQSDLNNVFQGTPLYTLYTGIISAGNNFYSTISGVLSSNYVYVFSLPTFTFFGKTFTGLQVSFDWYIPYKSYGDIIISCFLIIGYIRFLMNFIPNFFYGSGFIDHDVNNLQGRYDHL